jgi:hypothetical protein
LYNCAHAAIYANAVGGIAVDPRRDHDPDRLDGRHRRGLAFASHWSANLEYNYYDFGNHGTTLTANNVFVNINSLKHTMHTVTAGVDYHF